MFIEMIEAPEKIIGDACERMRNAKSASTIKSIMFELGVDIRNVFAASIPYVKPSNPEFGFVQRLRKDIVAPEPLKGLKIVTWNVNGFRSGIVYCCSVRTRHGQ